MKSKEYWEGRFIDLQRSQLKRADSFARELEDLHQRMQKEIDDDITVWHKKVATANGISMADAKKLMSRKDRKEFQWTLEEYEQHAKADLLSGVTSANVMNASANWHLSYLDGMKLQLEHHVDKLYKNIDSKTRNHFKESLNENYLNTAFELQKGIGIGEKMEVPYDERKLENILRTPWASDGKNFSQRIWKDRTQLVNNLQKHLSESVIRGESDTEMIQALSKDEDRAEFNTRRLVETESAYFDSLSEQQCCEDFGVEKYRFLAVLDMKTSDICQELDNKVFLEKDRQVGVNAPPMHPFCRSTTAPVIDEEFLTSRRAKNPKTGEYDEIPPEMNYKQWKEKYVEGKENTEAIKQEQVKTESSNDTGSSGAEIKIESPKVESEYKETPIPSREKEFDSKAYEDRVQGNIQKTEISQITPQKNVISIKSQNPKFSQEENINRAIEKVNRIETIRQNNNIDYASALKQDRLLQRVRHSKRNIFSDTWDNISNKITSIRNDIEAKRVDKIESFLKNNLNLQKVFLSNVSLSSAKKLKNCLTRIYNAMPEVFEGIKDATGEKIVDGVIKSTGDALALYQHIRPLWYNKLINKKEQNFFNKFKRLPNNIEKKNIIDKINKYLDKELEISSGIYLNNGDFDGFITSDLEGIYIFTKSEEEYDKKNKNQKGNSPPNCNNIIGTINHELGHAIDKLLGIYKIKNVQKLFDDNFLLTPNSEEYLSDYAYNNDITNLLKEKIKNNISLSEKEKNLAYIECVAEAISEYLTSPTPRKLSRDIWEIVKKEYKAKYGKELRL